MKQEQKKILVTGSKGFIGSNTSKFFRKQGYLTFGLGHGHISKEDLDYYGLDFWKSSDISIEAINSFGVRFDLIIHCGGSGSVGYSVENPYMDFKKTVDGTLEVLEYIRLYSPTSHLIYPSSPAVQGEHPDLPIKESYIGQPCSPYGYHKKIAEDLCRSYSNKYNIKISVVRLFSVFGIGLKKQLLWDAVKKLSNKNVAVEFSGTGNETRDFIHIDDVVKLFFVLLNQKEVFEVVNGGTGVKRTIFDIVSLIRIKMNNGSDFYFNKKASAGNPIYYWACQDKLKTLVDFKFMDFDEEIERFIQWAMDQND